MKPYLFLFMYKKGLVNLIPHILLDGPGKVIGNGIIGGKVYPYLFPDQLVKTLGIPLEPLLC